MTSKKKLRKRIRVLERDLGLSQAARTYQSVSIILGSTGGPAQVIEFPVPSSGRVRPLDLPSLGYQVRYVGPPIS